MGFSGFLDVAIGLVLMYLLLSLMCTTIVELMSTMLRWRSKTLKDTIEKIIDNPDLLERFYKHGLIADVKYASSGGNQKTSSDAATTPSDGSPRASDATETQPKNHPSYIDGHTFAKALIHVVSKGKSLTITELQGAIEKLPSSRIRDVLLANIEAGSATLTQIYTELGIWFDAAMDRLSGDYKRLAKFWTIVIALLVACIFNADTISVGRSLWMDETLRGHMVNAATQIVDKSGQPDSQCLSTDPGKDLECLLQRFKGDQEKLRPFPIGWSTDRFNELLDRNVAAMKILGLLLTGLALSLGAPFWFDLLDKFMKIRGTGPKPERTEDRKARA